MSLFPLQPGSNQSAIGLLRIYEDGWIFTISLAISVNDERLSGFELYHS